MCACRHCAYFATKKISIFLAPAARLAHIALIGRPREFQIAPPVAQHGGGLCAIILKAFSNMALPIVYEVL